MWRLDSGNLDNPVTLSNVKAGLFDAFIVIQDEKNKMVDSVTAKELIQKLYEIKGLDKKDATDLMLVMRLKEIIDKTNDGRYFLFNSTPY